MKLLLIIIAVLLFLLLVGWLGLQTKPDPFPPVMKEESPETISLPKDLPIPVERFYRSLYGEQLQVPETVAISGRARLRVSGITFPARFRFFHRAGQDYRHQIELTWFDFTIIKVNEWYVDGNARLDLPFGTVENKPKVDQGANLALWGESIGFPSVLLTDPRVNWEALDSNTANLKIPFQDQQQEITVHFNSVSGWPVKLEAMRYKNPDDQEKTHWTITFDEWTTIDGIPIFADCSITWADEDSPWAYFFVEEMKYNVDIQDQLNSHNPINQ